MSMQLRRRSGPASTTQRKAGTAPECSMGPLNGPCFRKILEPPLVGEVLVIVVAVGLVVVVVVVAVVMVVVAEVEVEVLHLHLM